MPMDHISNESMRAYLLGQLPDDQATPVEEEYFVNRAFFLKMQSEETALIADYLDGSLGPAETQHFESRYLHVPELQRKLEEVRRRREASQPPARPLIWPSWRLAFAAALIVVLGFGLWAYRSRLGRPELIAGGQLPGSQSARPIYLSPDIAKGSGSLQIQFEQPAGDSILSLILELPGQRPMVRCQARISMIRPNGRWDPVWNSPEPIVSVAAGGSQTLTLTLSSSFFHPGDYVVQVWSTDGGIRETYVYRVTERRT